MTVADSGFTRSLSVSKRMPWVTDSDKLALQIVTADLFMPGIAMQSTSS
jgi:hypothetical protein